MPIKPIALANEFIRAYGDGGAIDHLKLQKLTYFAQGWWLAFKGNELLTERPQVWRYGPVFQSLYQIFSPLGRERLNAPRGATPFGNGDVPLLDGAEFEQQRACVQWIWQEYGGLSGARLSDLTHELGTPWRNIAEKCNYRVPLNTVIPADADWAYFADLARQRGVEPRPFAGVAA